MSETKYWERTDSFEEKMRLLEAAWRKKDFRLVRALTDSLRSTALQAQAEEEDPGLPTLPAAQFVTVDSLPAPWQQWAQGWKFCRAVHLDETLGVDRPME